MRSEHQHIDDFFRKKEEEYQPESGNSGAGWEQMKAMLTPGLPPAPKGFRLLSTRRIIKYLGGFTVVTVITLVAITTLNSKKKVAAAKALATKTTVAHGKKQERATTLPSGNQTTKAGQPSQRDPVPTPASRAATGSIPAGSHHAHLQATRPARITVTAQAKNGQATPPADPATSGADLEANPAPTVKGTKSADTNISTPPQTTQATANGILPGAKKTAAGTPEIFTSATADQEKGPVVSLTPTQAAEKIRQFYRELDKPVQRFTYNVDRETIITGKEGTRLIIPANAFANRRGVIKNEVVTIILREYYTYDDMIAAKLTTTSGDDQLISGGMVYVEAQVNGERVNIASDKQIKLEMPTPQVDKDMQLFKGNRSSIKNAFQAKFLDNRMIDTVRFLKREADENGDFDWVAQGQKPAFQDLLDRTIKVFNPYGDPYLVRHTNKVKGWFYVSENCKFSDKEMKEKIRAHSNYYFDKIKLKRVSVLPVANYRSDADIVSIAGDSVYMTFRQALRKKLLTTEDSLLVLEQLRQEDVRNNQRQEMMNKYSFSITGLGWYNCDKYNNIPGPRVLFTFKPGEGFEPNTMVSHLVFTRYKSIIKGNYKGDKIEFGRVPQNEPVKVVCIGIKNGKVMACIQELDTDREEIGQLAFKETSPEQFRQRLSDLALARP